MIIKPITKQPEAFPSIEIGNKNKYIKINIKQTPINIIKILIDITEYQPKRKNRYKK